ncbi:MAG: hypothetical protein ABW321_17510 [Polyangiales bacterium]
MRHVGYFIDWNGKARCTDDPGPDYCCEVDSVERYVAVISKQGGMVHESPLYRSLDAIASAGIRTELVPGNYPWGRSVGRAIAAACPPPRPDHDLDTAEAAE